MEKDRTKGTVHEVKGDIKEMVGIGTATDNTHQDGKLGKDVSSDTAQPRNAGLDDDVLNNMPKE